MLHLLDESVEQFLRAEVPLPARDVEVAFQAPDKDWGAGVTKPTINLFLWDVRRNVDEREAGMELVEEDGRRVRRPPLPRVDCRYLVSAWTSEVRDEHALLGAVLAALLQHDRIDGEYLQGLYSAVRPVPSLSVAATDGKDQSDFWSALGGQLKPGLDLVVTATIDAALTRAAGPPVERYELTVSGPDGDDPISTSRFVAGEAEDETARGVTVRSSKDATRVGRDGRFLLRAEAGDDVVVETEKPSRSKVPRTGPLRVGRKRG